MSPITIKSSAPTRISFLGGSTDLDIFSSKYGGAVLSMAINIRVDNIVSFYQDERDLAISSFPKDCDLTLYDKIIADYKLTDIRHLVTSKFDGHIGAGLGTSGAFTVAMIGALEKLKGEGLNPYKIAEKAYHMEVDTYGKYGGRQDQYASAFGGLNYILFQDQSVVLPQSRQLINFIYPYMALFYIGGTRKSDKIQEKYRELTNSKRENLKEIKSLVSKGILWLERKNIDGFCEIMRQSWILKKASEQVTTPEIDKIYEWGMFCGAMAGKLLGAGGCGYMLFMVDPSKREKLCRELESLKAKYVDFEPDMTGLSVRIL